MSPDVGESSTQLLAEDPSASLDRERGPQVMELLRRVAREHDAAVLVVTHDHRALDVFDSWYRMEDGQLMAAADAGAIATA
jgi:putative ABC transport system ATP-binding protein